MSKLPRLKVKWWSAGYEEDETTCNFEQARDIIFGQGLDVLVFVGGQMIASYEELVQLAAQNQSTEDKEVIEVLLVPTAIPGG